MSTERKSCGRKTTSLPGTYLGRQALESGAERPL